MNFKTAFQRIVEAMTGLSGLPHAPELDPKHPDTIKAERWIGVFWTPAYTLGSSDETQEYEPGDVHWTHDASSRARITIRVQARKKPGDAHIQYVLMDLVELVRTALVQMAETTADNDFTCSIVTVAPFVDAEDPTWGYVRIGVDVGAFRN